MLILITLFTQAVKYYLELSSDQLSSAVIHFLLVFLHLNSNCLIYARIYLEFSLDQALSAVIHFLILIILFVLAVILPWIFVSGIDFKE